MSGREPGSSTRTRVDDARVAALVDRAPDLVGLFDADGGVHYLSPAAARTLTGADEHEFLDAEGDARTFRLHPDDLAAVVDAFDAAKARPGARARFAARTRHENGTWLHVEGEFHNLLDDPDVRGIVLSVNDVTERVVVEQQLRDRLAVEAALGTIARNLMRCAADEVDDCVRDALGRVAPMVGAQRANLFMLRDGGFEQTHAWHLQAEDPPAVERVEAPVIAAWWESIRRGDAVELDGRDLAPAAIANDPEQSIRVMRSVLAVPLAARDEVIGFVSFCHADEHHTWPAGAGACIEQLAALVSTAFERRDAEELRRRSEDAMRSSTERFRRIVQASPDLVIVLDTDGRITFASPAARAIFGYEPEEIIGSSAFDLVHPDDVAHAVEAFARAVREFRHEFVPLRVRHRDGSWIPVETLGSDLLDDPLVNGLLVNVRDVRDRERIAAELRDIEARFKQAWEHAPIGMGFAGRDGQFLEVNPAFCAMLGYSEVELLRESVAGLTHPDDRETNLDLHDALYTRDSPGYSLEKRFRHKDGSWRAVRVTVTPIRGADGEPLCSLGQVEDITERRKFEERLAFEATHDALTGLPLRKLLLDHLDLGLASARRGGSHVGVLFIDLDHFKRVNDSLGHAAGDDVLVEVADRLRASVRDGDTPGRFGGDEFVVVCPDLADPRDVVSVADRVLERLSEPFTIYGMDLYASASIGIAVAERGVDAETLLRQADTAAYRAKDDGRNRYEIFDEELRASVFARLQTEIALRRALEHDELLVLYQPVVTAMSGEIVGFEALVRWDRPGHGRVAPAEFLEVAEDTGLIVPLGRHVLSAACTQLGAWQSRHPDRQPFLSVNLSPRQLLAPDLVDDVQEALVATGVSAEHLWLELPETLLVHDTAQLVTLLAKLRDLGVQLSLDDFGTGFSSLTHLRFLPVGVLKIDRTFIEELGVWQQGATIVGSVISLAHALGMRVIAEGVETAEQLEILRTLNCDWIQGYYFSAPLLSGHATQMLASGRCKPDPSR